MTVREGSTGQEEELLESAAELAGSAKLAWVIFHTEMLLNGQWFPRESGIDEGQGPSQTLEPPH